MFLIALGSGTQVTQEPIAYIVPALIAGGIAACLVYLRMAKPEEVVEVSRKRGRPKKVETQE